MLSIARKIRILGLLEKVAPAWAIRRQALVIEHAFDSDLAKAKDLDSRQEIASQRQWEASEYWGALAEYRTNRLLSRARKLYLVPDELKWVTDGYANCYLDNDSLSKLNKIVVEEGRRAWDFRLKVMGVIVSALTGLVGTLIGLIAIWKKH
jgi:hypothetical protein